RIRPIALENAVHRFRVEHIGMERILRGPRARIVDKSAVLFRPEIAMHKPLLVPDCLERPRGGFGYQSLDMGRAERPEADLVAGGTIGIARVQWRGIIDQPQTCVEICLKKNIDMDVGGQIAAIACIAW